MSAKTSESTSDTTSPETHGNIRRRLRRIRRFLVRAIAVVAILAVVGRIALPYVLPSAVRNVVDGFQLEWEEMDLSLTGGSLTIRHARLTPTEGVTTSPLVELEYVNFEISTLALLSGELEIGRVEIDGADLRLHRDRTGVWNFAKLIAADPDAEPEDPDEDPPADPNAPFDPSLGFDLHAGRLQHVRVEVVDESVNPVLRTWFELSIRVSQLGSFRRDGQASLTLTGQHVDVLRLDSRWKTPANSVAVDTEFAIEGLSPVGLEAWLEPLGLRNGPRSSVSFGLRASGELQTFGEEGLRHRLSARLLDARIAVDDEELAGFDQVALEVPDLRAGGGTVDRLVVDNPRGKLRIDPTGALAFGSLSLVPSGPPTEDPTEAERSQGSDQRSAQDSESDPASLWALRSIALQGGAFQFVDQTTVPEARIACEALGVEWTGLDTGVDTQLRLDATLPELCESLQIRGTATIIEPSYGFGLDLAVRGLTLDRLKPLLDEQAIRCELHQGNLDVALTAQVTPFENGGEAGDESGLEGAFRLERLSFVDAVDETLERELLRLDEARVDGFSISDARTDLSTVAIRGLRLGAERDPDGSMRVLGLRLGVPTTAGDAVATANDPVPGGDPEMPAGAASDPAESPEESPAFSLTKLELQDLVVSWLDRTVEPALELAAVTITGSADDILYSDADSHGRFRVDVATGGAIFDAFALSGDIRQAPSRRVVSAQWTTTGLELDELSGYLRPAGFESILDRGRLSGRLEWLETMESEVSSQNFALTELVYRDEQTTFLESPAIRVQGLSSTGIERVVVEGLTASVHRLGDGRVEAFGLRTLTSNSESGSGTKDASESTADGEPDRTSTSGTERVPDAAEPELEPSADPIPFVIDGLRIVNVAVAIRDEAIQPMLATEARLSALGSNIVDGMPGSLEVRLELPELLESLVLTASADAVDDTLTANIDLQHPLRGLEAYLPPNIRLLDEKLELSGDLTVGTDPRNLRLDLTKLKVESSSAPRPWLEVPSLRVRGQLQGRDLSDLEISVRGVRALARGGDGTVEVGGLEIGETPYRSSGVARTDPDSDPSPGGEPEPTPPSSLVRSVRERPRLHLESLNIEIANFRWIDRLSEIPRPLDASLSIVSDAPYRFGYSDEDVAENIDPNAPLRLTLNTSVPPILRSGELKTEIDLAALEPEFDLHWSLDGLSGAQVGKFLPSFAESVDGSQLVDGRSSGNIHVLLHSGRDALGLPDLSREFGVDLQVRDVVVARADQPQADLELADFEVIVRQISPYGAVVVDSIDLSGFRVQAEKTPLGLQFAGLTMLSNPRGGAPAPAAPAEFREAGDRAAPPVSSEPATPAAPIQIDRMSVQDTSILFADSTGAQRIELPIAQIELDLQDLRLPGGDRPLRFSAFLEAGDTELPVPEPQESVLGGLLSSATDLVTSDRDLGTEVRPLFATVSATGEMTLGPSPQGRVRLDISELELLALQPFASSAGINIRSGRFDTRTNVGFKGPNGIAVDSRLVFKDLGLSDSGGSISKYLGLNAPIGTVLFALRNSAGEQIIPLKFDISGDGGITTRQITSAATAALASVLGNAVASAGLRVASPLTDLVNFGNEVPRAPLPAEHVIFPAGGIDWTSESEVELDRAEAFLRLQPNGILVLEHGLSESDRMRAERLANPSEPRLQSLVARMRQRRNDLRLERSRIAPEISRLFGSGRTSEGERLRKSIQVLDREIGQIEVALDELLRLLRPGAERRTDRRTRIATTAIATERLQRVRRALIERFGPDAEDRIDLKSGRGAVEEELERGEVRIFRRFRAGG